MSSLGGRSPRAAGAARGLTGRLSSRGKDCPPTGDDAGRHRQRSSLLCAMSPTLLAAFGGGLRAGQFIICGSLTAPMFLESGESGIDFELAPIGSVTVRFS